jgi:hypothetical protein
MFIPDEPVTFGEGSGQLRDYGDFTEIRPIVDELTQSLAVLVEGAPGSGKSHLIRDIQTGCLDSNIPALCLSMHVNAGSRQGAENAAEIVSEFRDKVGDNGGLIILDNADFVGYKGHSRSRSRAVEYAQAIHPLVKDILEDPKMAVLATVHDNAWREGRWKWADQQIDEPAQLILDAFPSRFTFEGKMSLVGLAHILQMRNIARAETDRPISLGQAAQVIRMLNRTGRANFFHANHLPVKMFLQNPDDAIAHIERGREERRQM